MKRDEANAGGEEGSPLILSTDAFPVINSKRGWARVMRDGRCNKHRRFFFTRAIFRFVFSFSCFSSPIFQINKSRVASVLALWLMLFAVPVAHAGQFEELTALAGQGAAGLALRLIDAHQPAVSQSPADWAQWERARLAIYQQQGDWAALAQRVSALPQDMPQEFARWALIQGAAAHLELGQGASARELLLRLLWMPGAGVESQLFAQWRVMVIRSYIMEGLKEDAYAAMLRYQQDYGDADVPTQLLHAQVMLISGRVAEAIQSLSAATGPEASTLRLLARLRNGDNPEGIVRETAAALADDRLAVPIKARLWATQAEAAGRSGDCARQMRAMEQVVLLDQGALARDGLFTITVDTLWDGYRSCARAVGNREQLLIGDFEPWYAAALYLMATQPAEARVVFAMLAQEGDTLEMRLRAHQQFIKLLTKDKQGEELVRRLYRDPGRFS